MRVHFLGLRGQVDGGSPLPSTTFDPAVLDPIEVHAESPAMGCRRKFHRTRPRQRHALPLPCVLSGPASLTLSLTMYTRATQHPPAPSPPSRWPWQMCLQGGRGAPRHAACMGHDLLSSQMEVKAHSRAVRPPECHLPHSPATTDDHVRASFAAQMEGCRRLRRS
jgi:hypothetical protein